MFVVGEFDSGVANVSIGLCSVTAFLHCGLRLMLEKDSENESVRNEKQRHYQSRKEECGSQLPRQ